MVAAITLIGSCILALADPPKPAATPEEAVERYVDALRRNDAGALMAILAVKRIMELQAPVWDKAAAEQEGLLDEKFGKAAKEKPKDQTPAKEKPKGETSAKAEPPKERSSLIPEKVKGVPVTRLVGGRIVEKKPKDGDEVDFSVRLTYKDKTDDDFNDDVEVTAVKEGGSWKVVPHMFRELLEYRRVSEGFAKQRTEQWIKDVKAGKYKSREEALNALKAPIIVKPPLPGPPAKKEAEKK
jgi:hypothetical protein